LAISAQTKELGESLSFLKFILADDIQKVTYYQNGGQPAHLDASAEIMKELSIEGD